MIWITWAALLLAHGAYCRWAQTLDHYALASVVGDLLLMAIALITMAQLQGMSALDYFRIGVFFIAFGTCGRQLMSSVLPRTRTPA